MPSDARDGVYLDENRRLVSVFRSPRRDGMYLYVDSKAGIAGLPEVLRELFGTPQHTMDLLLTPERRLARGNAAEVLAAIRDQGFFLQMPPVIDDDARAMIIAANDKLAPGRR